MPEGGGGLMAKCEYCGKEMLRAFGCNIKSVYCNEKRLPRQRFGEEGWASLGERCPDCGAKYGYYHHWGCDIERCPACGGQMIGCECKEVYILV